MDDIRIDASPVEGVEDALVLAPHGPIRGRIGESFRLRVGELASTADSLLLDLSDVEFMDSSAVGYLLNLHDQLKAKGGSLALSALTPSVRVVLDSIGLTSFFVIHDTVDEAASSLRQGSDIGSGPPGSDSGIL